jgi:hypothetical protein
MSRVRINRINNVAGTVATMAVFVTGLVLFSRFHIGDGARRIAWLGLSKFIWLSIHKASAVAFVAVLIAHIVLHREYIATVAGKWRNGLARKVKSKTAIQFIFLAFIAVILWTGFYPWISMPGATLENGSYHRLINIHNPIGIFALAGMCVHILKRRRHLRAPK